MDKEEGGGRKGDEEERGEEEDRVRSKGPVGLHLRRTRLEPRAAGGPWSWDTLHWERGV